MSAGTPFTPSNLQMFGPLMTGGLIVSGFGAVNSAIGSYFAAEAQKNQLKSQALNAKFAAKMAAINARAAEVSAQSTMAAGEQAIGRYTMQAGQARASAQAALASRGIQGGVGSAKEIIGSMDLIKQIDTLTMSANITRQAEAQRMQRQNYLAQATMAGLSAQNLNASAASITPALSGMSSLLGSAADIGLMYARNRRIEELLSAAGTQRF